MTDFYASYPVVGGGGVPIYPNFASFPVSAPNGTVVIDASTDILYAYNTGLGTWVVVGAGAVSLAGENYLSILGQQITAHPVNLASSNITGFLPLDNGGASPRSDITYVDANRTDSYTQDGSFDRPYKDLQTAIDALVTAGTAIMTINAAGTFGAIVLNAPAATAFLLRGSQSGLLMSSFTCTANNDSLIKFNMTYLTCGTLTLTGASNGTHFCTSSAVVVDSTVTGSINVTNAGLCNLTNSRLIGNFNCTNTTIASYVGGDGFTGNLVLVTNYSANTPAGFDATFFIGASAVMTGNVTIDAASSLQTRNGTRLGSPGGTITNNGDITAYCTFIRSNQTIGATGSFEARGTFWSGTLTNNGSFTNNNPSTQIGYTPTTSANWATVPTQAGQALDLLAVSGIAKSQSQNLVLASPNGSSGLPTFRGLVASDLPAGTGTVTSVSVVTANGVSGSVATATTTPAITLTLGAITPTSVTSPIFSSNTANAATAGILRLANTDLIEWRNAANSANVTLQVDASNNLNLNSGGLTLNGSTSGTFTQKAADSTTSYSVKWPNAQGGASTILQNDGSGNLSWASSSGITQLTGDVTAGPGSGSQAATIAANVVSNSKLAQMAAHTYKGNNTGSTANAADITSTQLTADLNIFTSSLQGLVPSSGGGTTNFLRADGTFAAPPGGGVSTVGTIDTQTASANGLVISGTSIYAQSASSSNPGLMNTAAQTLTGAKLFSTSLMSPIFSSNSNNPAIAGVVRLANSDQVAWRNNANSGNVNLRVDGSDNLNLNSGGLTLNGSTTGAFTQKAADSTTSYSVKWPSAQGGANTYAKNDGSGNLSWGSLIPALSPTVITSNTTLVAGNRYIVNSASSLILTLPASSAVGDEIAILGVGTGGWVLKSNASAAAQTVNIGGFTSATSSSSAVTLLTSDSQNDAVDLVAVTANTVWNAQNYVGALFKYITATGGTVTTDGNFKVHTFTSNGTFTITGGSGTVSSLVVAGGGGGGNGYGGGGGAGGLIYTTPGASYTAGAYTVTVGNGGAGATTNSSGSAGSNSVFDTITAHGGGSGAGGISVGSAGGAGGSGGGAGGNSNAGGSTTGGAASPSGEGFAGGNGNSIAPSSGGGGGAGGAGGNASSHVPGNGGLGLSNSITGAAVFYASGGGGCDDTLAGTASAGGGGAGATGVGVNGNNATANTGGGGGGSWYGAGGTVGGNGGSGIVIVRYRFQ